MTTTLYLAPRLDATFQHAAQSAAHSQQAFPFAPVSVLLPDSQAVHAARKQFGDAIGVRFYQFYGLSQQIIDSANLPIYRLSDTAVRRLVRQTLAEMARAGQLSSFLPVWQTVGFTQVLVEWLQEMKSQGITPVEVQKNAQVSGQARDLQLAEFYSAYQRFMLDNHCSDNDGLLWLAAEALEKQPDLAARQQLFIALGFDQFNPLQVRILRALAPRCAALQIYLPWDAQRPADALALARPAQTKQKLQSALDMQVVVLETPLPPASALARVQRRLFELANAANPGDASLELVTSPSREDEVRWAVKAAKRLLLEGVRPEKIAILAPNPGTYQRSIEVTAEEYGLPVQLERRISATPAAAALLNLLALTPDFPWRETLDALRSPYFRQPWLSPEQINQLEQLSRERPVLGGREQWRFALQPLAPRPMPEADEGGADEAGPQDRLARKLSAEALAAIESGLFRFFDLLTPPEPANWREMTLWLQQTVLGLFPETEEQSEALQEGSPSAPPPSLNMVQACQSAPDRHAARADIQVLRLITRALRALVQAAELTSTLGENTVTWSDYRGEIQRLLPSLTLPTDPLQPGVRFASLETGRSSSVDHLFILGLSEGEFPRPAAPDVLYAPRERESHPLALIRLVPGAQASLWWQVVNNCRHTLTLLRPRLDEKGAPWLASSFWDAAIAAAGASKAAPYPELELPIVAQPSLQDAASPSELLVALANQNARQVEQVPGALQIAWQASQTAYQLLRQRQSWQPIPAYEGWLQNPVIQSELQQRYGPRHPWSASRLNSYGKCAYIFFAQVILGLQRLADPAEGFDPMQRGTLLHAILENLYTQLSAQQIELTPGNWQTIETLLQECCRTAFQSAPQRYGFQPNALWTYEQAELARMLNVLVRSECETNGETPRFSPYLQEMRFGIQGDRASLTIESADGTQFLLHGIIDRVDRNSAGQLRLIDYKSGSSLYSKPDIAKGLAFQSPFYALAAEQLLAEQVAESYYLHMASRKTSGKLSFNGSVLADVSVIEAVARAAHFVQNTRAGIFPALPAKNASGQNNCASSCEFASLCRPNRHLFAKTRQAGLL